MPVGYSPRRTRSAGGTNVRVLLPSRGVKDLTEGRNSVSPRKLNDSIGLSFYNVPNSIEQHLGGNVAGTFLPDCDFSELAMRICRRP